MTAVNDICRVTDLDREICWHCQSKAETPEPEVTAPTEPGVYGDIPEAVYHADRGSLSHSGALKLLPPSCPAKFKESLDAPPEHQDYFDFGHAAHALVLGTGLEIVEVKAKDWRTKAAQAEKTAIHVEGKVPLLTADLKAVRTMAWKVREHSLASELLSNGQAEMSLYWTDPATWTRLRARIDWMTQPGGRLTFVDYKTTTSASPRPFSSSAHKYGYHQQAAWYTAAARELKLSDDPRFLFIAQEKEPPYLVTVHEYGPEDIAIGNRLNRRAIEIYAKCEATGEWPGYGDTIHPMRLPYWARYDSQEAGQ